MSEDLDGDGDQHGERESAGAGEAPPLAALHAAWAPTTAAPRSRSSSAARAATSGTSTGNRYLDGAQLAVLRRTSATAAPTSPRPAPTRRASSTSSRPGPTRTRAAIELAAKIASLTPGDLNRVFFTSGGSEAVESALKLAAPVPQAHRQPEQDEGDRARDRLPRHVARRALGDRHHGAARAVRAAHPRRLPRPEHEHLPARRGLRRRELAEAVRERILFEGPETVAAVILEPVQNAGGCFTPPDGYFQRIREICDEYDVLMISDEVICSWGRLGALVRRPALRLPAGRHHDREGHHLRVSRRWGR